MIDDDLLQAISPEAEAAGLAALREAWKHPRELTPAQANTLRLHHRQSHVFAGQGCHVKTRWKGGRKVIAWRIPGRGGADLERPPSGRAVVTAVEAHRELLAKGRRTARLLSMNKNRVGVKARQDAGRITEKTVLSMLAQGRKVYAIAGELGITEHHVRRIRRAAAKTDMTEKG